MNAYTFHITLYDLGFLGTIFIGLTVFVFLWSAKSINRSANRFLALALVTIVLWVTRILGIDIGLSAYIPYWSWLPLQFSLALGPLIYFYVLKLTRPDYKFRRKDLLHFSPLLLELGAQVLEVIESTTTGTDTYATLHFQQLNPVIQLFAFFSVGCYLYLSNNLIEYAYQHLKFIRGDRQRSEWRWLRNLLTGLGLLWLLWVPYAAVEYFYYHHQPGLQAYYPLYLLVVVIFIRIATLAFLRPVTEMPVSAPPVSTAPLSVELKQKGIWLKQAMQTNLYYRDPELSLSSLAEKLGIPPHDLSRVINAGLKKNFNDFINEYRVKEVARKMQDPTFRRLTLLGIAFDSGFNSKTTFHRIFKQMTGKSPAEFKDDLEKQLPSYNLEPQSRRWPVILRHDSIPGWSYEQTNRNFMWSNYLKIAWRNLVKNRAHTFINVTGLSVGMAVAMLIGLWIWDELSYDKYFQNYDRLVQVMQHQTFNGEIGTQVNIPLPLGPKLREDYTGPGNAFKYVVMTTGTSNHIITYGDKKLNQGGDFIQPEAPEMFTLKMVKGTRSGLRDQSSIMLSATLAKALFGDADPIGRIVRIDNKYNVNVTGVYEDLPRNTSLNEMAFMMPWDLYLSMDPSLKNSTYWGENSWQMYAQLNPDADINQVSARIMDLKKTALTAANDKVNLSLKPALFLYPANKWYLYSEFKNGVVTGGKIEFVRLFGLIGIFVLLLACINFMNLSTARSEKRAKEVGIRKTLGSLRQQLVSQFFAESLLVSVFSFFFCLIIVLLILPWFNQVAGKNIEILWTSPLFWSIGLGFTLFTGVIAGSYPAFYLSSFKPIKVLKGTFRAGRQAALPRKVLVVLQFAVSVALIIGTIVVFRQVQFTKNRQVGYTRDGLIQSFLHTSNIHNQFDAVKHDLVSAGAITDIAESWSPVTNIWSDDSNFSWEGMAPGLQPDMKVIGIGPEFGKTVRWQVSRGRDFSREFPSDSSGLIINETAVKFMNLKNPIGMTIKFYNNYPLAELIFKDKKIG